MSRTLTSKAQRWRNARPVAIVGLVGCGLWLPFCFLRWSTSHPVGNERCEWHLYCWSILGLLGLVNLGEANYARKIKKTWTDIQKVVGPLLTNRFWIRHFIHGWTDFNLSLPEREGEFYPGTSQLLLELHSYIDKILHILYTTYRIFYKIFLL